MSPNGWHKGGHQLQAVNPRSTVGQCNSHSLGFRHGAALFEASALGGVNAIPLLWPAVQPPSSPEVTTAPPLPVGPPIAVLYLRYYSDAVVLSWCSSLASDVRSRPDIFITFEYILFAIRVVQKEKKNEFADGNECVLSSLEASSSHAKIYHRISKAFHLHHCICNSYKIAGAKLEGDTKSHEFSKLMDG